MIGLPERRPFCVQDGSGQNKGGYFEKGSDDVEAEALNSAENVSPILIGLAVDYRTRFMSGVSAEDAFEISKKGSCTRFIRSLSM